MADSTTLNNQEEFKFDASQYEFFGKNVTEHEIGGFDAHSDEEIILLKKSADTIAPASYTDHNVSNSLMELNEIDESRTPKANPNKICSSEGSFKGKREKGIIKHYNNKKGYGFIIPNGGGQDIFVHCSSLKSEGHIHIFGGTNVEYESVLNFSNGKLQAINVTAPHGKLLQDGRKFELGEVNFDKNSSVENELHKNQVKSTMSNSSNFGKCEGGKTGLAWCYYCGKLGYFYHY